MRDWMLAHFLPTLGFCGLCGNQEGCSHSPHLVAPPSACRSVSWLYPCSAAGAGTQNTQHRSDCPGSDFYPQPCALCFHLLQQRNFGYVIRTQSPRRRHLQAEQSCCCRGVAKPGPLVWHCSSLRRSANLPQLSVITALLIHLLILDL